MLRKEDYIRFYIISKKINEKNLNDDEIADIKVLFYSYLAIYFNHENRYREAARSYRIIWETLLKTKKMIEETLDFGFSTSVPQILSNYVGFLVLSPYCAEIEKELKELSCN